MAVEPSSKDDTSNSIWSKLNVAVVLVGAVVTTVVTLVGTYIYVRVTASQPRLEYEVIPAPALFGELEGSRLFTVVISNAGEAAADEVRVGIVPTGGQVTEFDVERPPALQFDGGISPSGAELVSTSPALNPGDSVRVSLIAEYAPGVAPGGIEVDVRGAGVTGKERRQSDDGGDSVPVWLAVLTALAGTSFSMAALLVLRRRLRIGRLRLSGDEPREVVLADLSLRHGLEDLFVEYLRRPALRWSLEADYVTMLALKPDTDPHGRIGQTQALLSELVCNNHGIHRHSRQKMYLNIARLAYAAGDGESVRRALAEARAIDSNRYEDQLDLYRHLRSADSYPMSS